MVEFRGIRDPWILRGKGLRIQEFSYSVLRLRHPMTPDFSETARSPEVTVSNLHARSPIGRS